jgi:hypothetical protein
MICDSACEDECANDNCGGGSCPDCSKVCCHDSPSLQGFQCPGSSCEPGLSRDKANCGSCGHACAADELCSQAQCKPNCFVSTPPASVVAACGDLCAKMGPSCKEPFLWSMPHPSCPGTGGGGIPTWTDAATCRSDCIAAAVFTGPCADDVAALIDCWSTSLTCSNGAAQFNGCAGPSNTASQCVDKCANYCS